MIILGLLGYWGWHGFYQVPPASYGVASIFNKVTRITEEGRHWNFPPPLGKVSIIPSHIQIKTPSSWYMITSEGLPVRTSARVSCRIIDPERFYTSTGGDPEFLLQDVEAAILKKGTEISMRELLSQKIPLKIRIAVKKILSSGGCNGGIVDFKTSIPSPVSSAVEEIRTIYIITNRQLQKATAMADMVTREARIYARKLTMEAFIQLRKREQAINSTLLQYRALLPYYKSNPRRIKELLNMQMLQDLMKKSGKIILRPARQGVEE